MVSIHPADMREEYCPRCHVFIRDVKEASPAVRRAMAEFCHSMATRLDREAGTKTQQAKDLRKQADIWERATALLG
jgi:hypothetical protein